MAGQIKLACVFRLGLPKLHFEPDYAYKRYTYKKMSVSYPKLINFREDFFLRGQVK